MTAIQWISKEAKAIRKKHPSLAWSQCIKKASANYKAKHKTTTTKKKVGAVKYVEKGEPKSAKAKKVYQVNRTKKGTFKSVTRIAGTTTHKDTKSHNVNVRVVSGIRSDNILESLKKELQKAIWDYEVLKERKKDGMLTDPFHKRIITRYPNYIKSLRKQVADRKKTLKQIQ